MLLSKFDYKLPKDLIAQYPLKKREGARLMVLSRAKGSIEERMFTDILEYIEDRDLLLLNETKVIKARMFGKKEYTGGKVEVFFIRGIDNKTFEAFIRPKKRVKPGTCVQFGEKKVIIIKHLDNGHTLLRIEEDITPYELVQSYGEVPLPPYIKRKPTNLDKQLYQTVYAKIPGAVAAPTAGLHFSSELLKELRKKEIEILKILLHTGPGTFRPVTTENIEEHKMEEEYYEIGVDVAKSINDRKGRLFAVGTTTVRAIETAVKDGKVSPGSGWTNHYIYPPYKFKVVDCILTNFHLPKTSLIIMVSAFAGKEFVLKAYNKAIKKRYRFYSYGDAMLII